MKRIILIALALVCAATMAGANNIYDVKTAHDLHDICLKTAGPVNDKTMTSDEMTNLMYCLGYLGGATDMVILSTSAYKNASGVMCPSGGISREQARRIFNKYVIDNPRVLNHDARAVLIIAMAGAFPCK